MLNKTSLPTQAELNILIDVLDGAGGETSELEPLQALGAVDVTNLAEDLVGRLERGIEEMRANAQDVPAALSNTVELLHAHIEQEPPDVTTEEWVDSLLAGRVPPGRGQPTGDAPAFRDLDKDLLTEEDLKILKDMAEEIRRQKES